MGIFFYIMVIELSGVQFGLKSYAWFKIDRAPSTSSIWNYKYDFRPKLHETKFNYYLLHPFDTGLGHFKYFIDAVLSRFEVKFIHFWGGKSKSFGNKSSKICHRILFVYHFPAIWLVTLNKPWNLIGCFVFSVACSLAGKKMWFKAKNGAIRE